MKLLGIDIGGTKTECALLELTARSSPDSVETLFPHADHRHLRIVDRQRFETHRKQGLDSFYTRLQDAFKNLMSRTNLKAPDINGIGIGLPGSVDPKTDQMLAGNSNMFSHQPVGKKIQEILKTTLVPMIDNDANCFALAEAYCGAGVSYCRESQKSLDEVVSVGIILGTGVGGGIVANGKTLRGAHGGGAELGHTELYSEGHPCYCARTGCVEQYLSGPALEALMATRLYSQIEGRPTASQIFELAAMQDPIAVACVRKYKRDLAKFVANVTNFLDPDYVVFGGGMSNQGAIYDGLSEAIAEQSFVPKVSPQIYKNQLGDSAGVIGAALVQLTRN